MLSLIDRLKDGLTRPLEQYIEGDHAIGGILEQNPLPVVDNPIAAAVLVPIIVAPTPRLLLTQRAAHMRKHAGQIAFPGGRVDQEDTSAMAAALREANEEIGLPPEQVTIIGMADKYRTGTGFVIDPVVGLIPPDLPMVPNADEVADWFEMPLEHALDPKNHEMRKTEYMGRMRHYYVIEWENRHIWGATAGILVNLSKRL